MALMLRLLGKKISSDSLKRAKHRQTYQSNNTILTISVGLPTRPDAAEHPAFRIHGIWDTVYVIPEPVGASTTELNGWHAV